jgi:NAD(P)-dependent dehydrogenase (short-subunit alcohol dehydrogenase family)
MGAMAGKVALVTGAASGIGRATAARLAAEGARVLLADIDADGAARAAAEIDGRAVILDVADPEAWARLSAELDAGPDTSAGLDVAVLNAGVLTGEERITHLSDAAYRRAVGVNLDGVVFGTRALVPHLSKRTGGAIVAVVSLAGLMPYPPDPIYAVTKHGVIGFVRSVAGQLQAEGITINAVCPGLTDTRLVSESMRAQLSGAGFPLMPPEQIATAVVEAVLGGRTGEALVCQPGRDATVFRYPNIPGPRGPGVSGQRPPEDFAMRRPAPDG